VDEVVIGDVEGDHADGGSEKSLRRHTTSVQGGQPCGDGGSRRRAVPDPAP
jgi:hypothetical protein